MIKLLLLEVMEISFRMFYDMESFIYIVYYETTWLEVRATPLKKIFVLYINDRREN